METLATTAPTGVTVHRTPVCALDGRILGYSLAVQPGADARGVPTSAEALDEAVASLDLAHLVADRYAFLPATAAMLEGFVPTPVVPGRLVLELSAGYPRTDGARGRAAALRGLGMTLALADYRGEAAQVALLPYLGFVVVDAGPGGPPLAEVVHQAHRAGVRVIADRVESLEEENACRAAGVDAVRGGPSTREQPPATPGVPTQRTPATAPDSRARVLRAGEMQCLAIMHLLNQPEVGIGEVAQVIETDPVLTLRVLHLVNSGAYALTHQVDTVRQAVVLLGPSEVSTLVAALALDARPDAMDRLWFILARAMTCEALADDSAAYTVGMLSALAHQLGVPVEAVLEKVGVSETVAEAIRIEAGPLGSVLHAVRAHEQSDPDGVLAAGHVPGDVSRAYMRCLRDALAIASAVTRSPGF